MRNKLLIVTLILLMTPITYAAISYDRSTFAQAIGPASSVTFSHTGATNVTFIVVGTATRELTDANRPIANVSYAGAYLAKAREDESDANDIGTSLWWKAAPSTGANNIIINLSGVLTSGSVGGFGMTLAGVAQTSPIGNTTTALADIDPFNYSIVTTTDDSWVIDVLYDKDDSGVTAVGTEIQRNQSVGGPSTDTRAIGSQLKSTAGIVYVSWDRVSPEGIPVLGTAVEFLQEVAATNTSCVNYVGSGDYSQPCNCTIANNTNVLKNKFIVTSGTGTMILGARVYNFSEMQVDNTCQVIIRRTVGGQLG